MLLVITCWSWLSGNLEVQCPAKKSKAELCRAFRMDKGRITPQYSLLQVESWGLSLHVLLLRWAVVLGSGGSHMRWEPPKCFHPGLVAA